MKKIKNVEKVVVTLMEKFPDTRDDDYLLFASVLNWCGVKQNENLFHFLWGDWKEYPTFKRVERARRHVQELRPDLAGKIRGKRDEERQVYKEYNRSGLEK